MAGGGGKRVMVIMPAFAKRQKCADKIIAALIAGIIVPCPKQVADGVDTPSGVVNEKQSNETTPDHAGEEAGPALSPKAAQDTGKHDSSSDPPKIKLAQSQDQAVANQVGNKSEIRLMRVSKHPADVRMPPPLEYPLPSTAAIMGGVRISLLVTVSVMLPVACTPENYWPLSGHAARDSKERLDGSHTFETSVSEQPMIAKGYPEHGNGVHPQAQAKIECRNSISKKPEGSPQKHQKWRDDCDNRHSSRW